MIICMLTFVSDPLGRQVAITSKAMTHWADQLLASHGSSLTTWIVLQHVSRAAPPGLSQREIAQNMSVGGPALVRHLDRLQDEGLLRRTRDNDDRRITRVTVTPKGRRHLDRLRVVMDAHDQAMRAELSSTEVRALEKGLAKLAAYVDRTKPFETDVP